MLLQDSYLIQTKGTKTYHFECDEETQLRIEIKRKGVGDTAD